MYVNEKIYSSQVGSPQYRRLSIPKFDPKRFTIANLQAIIGDNVIKRDQLTQKELALLGDPEIAKRLDVERKLYSSILHYYREHKK